MQSSFTLLKKAFDTVFDRPVHTLTIMAVPAVLTFISAFIEDFGTSSTHYTISTVVFVISIVATIFMTIALTFSIADPMLSVKEAYRQAAKEFVRYFAYALALTVIMIIGFLLLIIPGIYLSVALSLSAYFLLLEKKSIKESIIASKDAVKGRWWSVALRIIVLILASVLLLMVIEFVSGMVSAFAGDDFGYALSTTLGLVATPIGIAYMYEIYKDLKGVRQEGSTPASSEETILA